jgi:GNAT superfamily N-acetyltransferase
MTLSASHRVATELERQVIDTSLRPIVQRLITDHSQLPWSGVLPIAQVAELHGARWEADGAEILMRDAWQQSHLGAIVMQELPWDSELLAMPCARLYPLSRRGNYRNAAQDGALLSQLVQALRDRGIQLADIKVSGEDLYLVRSLEESGFHVVDMLLTLGVSREKLPEIVSRFASRIEIRKDATMLVDGSVLVRPIESRDHATMRKLAREAFSDTNAIQDRFFMEPRIPHERAQDLFEQWLVNSIGAQDRSEGVVLVAEHDGKAVGFLTMAAPRSEALLGYWQDGLNAMLPEARGHGIYRALVMAAMRYTNERGGGLLTRTQVSTSRVISSWLHMGADLYESFFTLHFTP